MKASIARHFDAARRHERAVRTAYNHYAFQVFPSVATVPRQVFQYLVAHVLPYLGGILTRCGYIAMNHVELHGSIAEDLREDATQSSLVTRSFNNERYNLARASQRKQG